MNFTRLLLIALLFMQPACAGYSLNVLSYRSQMEHGNYKGAHSDLGEASRNPDRLLFLLESGLLAHYDGDYRTSNGYFAEAERVADVLYTRSASREVAALLTNDEARYYRGDAFENVFIHYYRALNYWYLGLPEDALVECRKANLKLASRAAEAAALEMSGSVESIGGAYRNDAFLHYVTGLFYESQREWNDAWVSYGNARRAYRIYGDSLGVAQPGALGDDLQRLDSLLDGGVPPSRATTSGELVLFVEVGFVPRKVQREWNLPLYDHDIRIASTGKTTQVARTVGARYDWHGRRRHHRGVDYWMRVAMPDLLPTQTQTASFRISSGSASTLAELGEDVGAIAERTFRDNLPGIRTRTIARALVKLAASEGLEKKNKVLGFLANLFGASVEAADTRSWVSLPDKVYIARLQLPPGTHQVRVTAEGADGRIVKQTSLDGVRIEPGNRTFRNIRFYR